MRKHRYMKISQLICTECGAEMRIPRMHCAQREKGHLKDMYCPMCKRDTKFKEIRYNEFYKTMTGEIIAS